MANFPSNSKMPHVDMTPMVDLGFLLITFFMLATVFSKEKVIETIVPANPDLTERQPEINCQRTLTLLLDASEQAKFFSCPLQNGDIRADSVDFSKNGLRHLLLEKQAVAKQVFGGEKDLIVLLKTRDNAPYKRVIDAIDELRLTKTRFMLSKMEAQDSVNFQF